jgi:hypothetical protein
MCVVGCGVQVALTKRYGLGEKPRARAPKEPCEDIQVLRGRAPHEWEPVAVIDLAAFSVRALPRDDDAFLELVRPAVCEAGGDAVIAGIDGNGRYVLGTVIAWVEPDASSTDSDEDSGSTAEPVTAPASGTVPLARRSPTPICPEDTAC